MWPFDDQTARRDLTALTERLTYLTDRFDASQMVDNAMIDSLHEESASLADRLATMTIHLDALTARVSDDHRDGLLEINNAHQVIEAMRLSVIVLTDQLRDNLTVAVQGINQIVARLDTAGSTVDLAARLDAVNTRLNDVDATLASHADRLYDHKHEFVFRSREPKDGTDRVIYRCATCQTVHTYVEPR